MILVDELISFSPYLFPIHHIYTITYMYIGFDASTTVNLIFCVQINLARFVKFAKNTCKTWCLLFIKRMA